MKSEKINADPQSPMHRHHEESIKNLAAYFQDDPGVLAVVLGGSVAKGLARPDSDLDALVVVTDEKLDRVTREGRLSECVTGHCTYEGGYFDIKYMSLGFLRAVMEKGSEPSRNAWVGARCLFSRVPEITGLIPKIGVFQESERADKMLSFYSALSLNVHYFWRLSEGNAYLRARAATDIVLFGLRMLLQEAGVLFSCHKSLELQVAALPEKPAGILDKSRRLLAEFSDDAMRDFADAVNAFITYKPPENFSVILSRYVEDNELWWHKQRPVIAEW